MKIHTTISKLFFSLPYIISRPVAVAVGILVILALFIVPLPPSILDILIVTNLAIALVIILRALYATDIQLFFSFPTMLLLATFFRLSLNISSTRLILLNGDNGMHAAGQVIQSFGKIVVQGDFIVGAIIFIIISVVNFVVIAKGSARVAEVSARFMLDALPGKQLAIDADFRVGNITKEQAAERRGMLAQESHFFGAMDGSMKFVQGDAIAGLIITAINAFGGVAIGLSRNLELSEAINTFGVLTIGDGLANILPALLISVAAGIIVTQVSSTAEGVSTTPLAKLQLNNKVFFTAAAALGLLALLPGFPVIPFFMLAGVLLLITYSIRMRDLPNFKKQVIFPVAQSKSFQFLLGTVDAQRVVTHAALDLVDPLRVRVSKDLQQFFTQFETAAKAIDEFSEIVRKEASELLGVPLPSLKIVADKNLHQHECSIDIRGVEIDRLFAPLGAVFVGLPESQLRALGIDCLQATNHPITLSGACWIKGSTEMLGLDVLGVAHFSTLEFLILKGYGCALDEAESFIEIDEVQKLLNRVRLVSPELYASVFDNKEYSVSDLSLLVRKLVRDGIGVRDVKKIVEEVSRFQSLHVPTRDKTEYFDSMYECVRAGLRRSIQNSLVGLDGRVNVFKISGELESIFRDANKYWSSTDASIPIESGEMAIIVNRLDTLISPIWQRGVGRAVLACPEDIRPIVSQFVYIYYSPRRALRVVSENELSNSVHLDYVGALQAA